MNAATLTALRARNNQGPDGDRLFLVNCQLGKNGKAAQLAYYVAYREAAQDGPTYLPRVDGRIADRVIELVDATDPATAHDEDALTVQLDTYGHAAWQAAGGDRAYALWLFAAGAQFHDLAKAYPLDLVGGTWRVKYDNRLHPEVAAKLALHEKPMVWTNDRDQLVCPVCDTSGEIVEEEQATRHNTLYADEAGIYAATRSSDFDHRRFLCRECGSTVRLPAPIVDWS